MAIERFSQSALFSRAHLDVPPTCYWSGASRPADFSGLADAGVPVGVVWTELGGIARVSLISHVNRGGRVLVDSGAFSGAIEHFSALLADYDALAGDVDAPQRLQFVGPDIPGDPEATVERVQAHAAAIRAVSATGARVLLPVHRGERNPVETWEALVAVCPDAIPALPCRRYAFTPGDAARFVAAAGVDRVHLLGVGPFGPAYGAYQELIAEVDPAVRVTCDANRLRALTGRDRLLARTTLETGADYLARERECPDSPWRDVDDTEAMAGVFVDGDLEHDPALQAAVRDVLVPVFGREQAEAAYHNGELVDLVEETPDPEAILRLACSEAWQAEVRARGEGGAVRREAVRRAAVADREREPDQGSPSPGAGG